ncbi:MAG: hypothetical protein ACR2G6_10480 [Gemmatimonadaceae bacterium]
MPAPARAGILREVVIAAAVSGIAILFLYRPWITTPFGIRDWSAMLLIFERESTFWTRFTELNRSYSVEARIIPIAPLWQAFSWSLFGSNSVGWQWSRVCMLLAIAVLAYVVMRRFRTSLMGAALGASLFILSGAASSTFQLQQVMEPLGITLVLVATLIALRYHGVRNPMATAAGLAVLLSLSVLVKETFLACIPFVVLVALCRRPDDTFAVPHMDRRAVILLSVLATVISLVNLVPLLMLRAQTSELTYAGKYTLALITPAGINNTLRAMFLPVTRVLLFPANVAFLALLVAGSVAAMWTPRVSRPSFLVPALALTLSLSGVIIYAPWAAFPGYYAHAFMLGSGLLVAWSVTALEGTGLSVARWGAYAMWLPVVLWGGVAARNSVETYHAARVAEVDAVRLLPTLREAPEIIVAVPTVGKVGVLLRDYALALGERQALLPLRDATCAEAVDSLRRDSRSVVLLLPDITCDPALFPGAPVRTPGRQYRTREWRMLREREDSMQAMVWRPRTS